ncbi:Amidohydrolase [compost metagenome]
MVSLYPDQRFVIDHIAKPDIKGKGIQSWEKGIRKIAQYPNVYCKLSGMFTEADWQHWKADDFIPYMDVVFNTFGTDRVMFGSDWPVCLLAASYQQSFDVLQQYLKQLSAEEKAKVMGLNAQNFYRL